RTFLYVNQGDGTFREDAIGRGTAMDDGQPHHGFSVAVGDYDNDGYADLFFTEWRKVVDWQTTPPPHARLFRNRGAAAPGTFVDVTESAGVVLGDPRTVRAVDALEPVVKDKAAFRTSSFAAAFVDLDGDGWLDLAVTGDFGTSQLFWNDHDGTFTDG